MIAKIRQQFPILRADTNSQPLVYLDNAATTQKPIEVIKKTEEFYSKSNANVHRGVYKLSELATFAYQEARDKVAKFIGTDNPSETIFVRGATEAINLVATSYGQSMVKANDEIIISTMEHHSNIVPWQELTKRTGAKLKVINIHQNGELDLDHYQQLLNDKTKMVAITQMSNALGTINPVKEMISLAHQHGVPVLVDGAQAVAHMRIDVKDLDCDFYVFSSHKMYGPTGVGVLYGKEKLLTKMPPYQAGGDMIETVSFDETTFAPLPNKFEAGTPNIAGAIGLGATIDFLNSLDMYKVADHEQELLNYATSELNKLPGLKIIGEAKNKAGIISFVLDKVHPHDLATILDTKGVAIRAGNHCAMPLMDFYEVPGTTRVSFGIYNTKDDIDILVLGIKDAIEMFSR